MISGILFTLLFGLVWGALWGAIDGIAIIKGFLSSPHPVQQIIRSFLSMLIASFITTLLLGGGNSIIAMIVALVTMYYARPWVMQRWRW